MESKQLRLLYLLYLRRKRKMRTRNLWVHPLNAERNTCGAFTLLYGNLRQDESKFFNYFRMSTSSFDELLNKLEGALTVQSTHLRESIPAVERLAVTIRYLASGNRFSDLQYTFRMGRSTIASIVTDVCEKIWTHLNKEVMPYPTTERLEEISERFMEKAQFPHCIGSVDGKQVRCIKPQSSGSLFYNCKHYFSVNLMAVVDAEYRFIFIDVGAYGKDCDSAVFRETDFWKAFVAKTLVIPRAKPLTESTRDGIPYFLVGDEAFGLHENLMRPYSGKQLTIEKRIFNYRFSRARRYVKCAFGILSNKWRIFHRPMNVSEGLTVKIIKACCILHNFGFSFEDTMTISGLYDLARNAVTEVRNGPNINAIRGALTDYFMSEAGQLQWQWSMS